MITASPVRQIKCGTQLSYFAKQALCWCFAEGWLTFSEISSIRQWYIFISCTNYFWRLFLHIPTLHYLVFHWRWVNKELKSFQSLWKVSIHLMQGNSSNLVTVIKRGEAWQAHFLVRDGLSLSNHPYCGLCNLLISNRKPRDSLVSGLRDTCL